MPKVIDLPTVTDMSDADYFLMELSGGGTKKINKSNAVNKFLSFYTVGVSNLSELNTVVTNGSSALYFTADVSVGGVTIPQYSRGMCINAHNSADGVIMVVDVSRNFYHGFRNGSSWSVRTDKQTSASGIVTKTSGANVTASYARVIDRIVYLYMAFSATSAVAAGSDVFVGTVASGYRPNTLGGFGSSYYSSSGMMVNVNPSGEIKIRVISGTIPNGATFAASAIYFMD